MEDVGIVYGHFGIFCGHFVYFSRFGLLWQEKSGNPAASPPLEKDSQKFRSRNWKPGSTFKRQVCGF
jgi:hypothetical protein